MAPKYVLTFFNFSGLAEVPRILFTMAGVEFEDKRIDRAAWGQMKSGFTFGHLPILEVDGKMTLSESGAITRYIAREHGFCGKNSAEEAQVDMINSEWMDFAMKCAPMLMERDPQKKEEMKLKFVAETMPHACAAFEKVLQGNKANSGFFVGDKVTYADITSYNICVQIVEGHGGGSSALDSYPLLKAHTEMVAALPGVKAWLDKRPQDEIKHH